MKVIVVGCGKVGTAIMRSLASEGHDVVAIDENKNVVSSLSDVYDVMCVVGNGTEYETLEGAGISDAELFIAATPSDEINMLSCFMAKRMGASYTVARIRNPEISEKQLKFIKQQLEISYIINPDLLAAKEIFNILRLPAAVKIETFSRRNFEMIELILKNDSKLDGLSIKEMRKQYQANYLVCAVQRGDEVFIPSGDFVLKAGDKIGITAVPVELQKLFKQLGLVSRQARNVIILGASRSSAYLTRMLTKSGHTVKVIDMRDDRCEEFAKAVPEANVIHGNGTEQDVLMEEGITNADAFVALTGMDEANILISCFAASVNDGKVVTKVNRGELTAMAQKVGLDTIITPKKIVSNVLVWYARAIKNSMNSNIETLYKLMDGKVEAIEFITDNEFKYSAIEFKKLKIKQNILIAGIIRGKKVIIPSGDDMIMPGDRVVIFAAGQKIANLSDIISE